MLHEAIRPTAPGARFVQQGVRLDLRESGRTTARLRATAPRAALDLLPASSYEA